MKFLFIAMRVVVFIFLFGLALANTQESQLHIFAQTVWRAPMIVIGLAFFIAGLAVSLLFTIPTRMRAQLEIAALKRRLKQQDKQSKPVDKEPITSLNPAKNFS